MAQSKLYPVVMAGGSGSRLWPLSRVLYPKQFFLCLRRSHNSMLQTTICRLNGVECESPVVICMRYRFIVAEQLRQLTNSPRTLFATRQGVTLHLPLHWRRWRQS